MGIPINGSQCYKQLSVNHRTKVTLATRHASFIAVGRDMIYSNFDATLTFVVLSGKFDIYISTNSRAVRVTEERGSGSHSVSVSQGTEVVSRSRRNVAAERLMVPHGPKSRDTKSRDITKRRLLSGSVSSAANSLVYHYQVDERLTLSIPQEEPEFQQVFHYVTFYAQRDSTLIFEYQQLAPRLNLYIFFGLFFSTVTLMSGLMVASWGLLRFILGQRQAAAERELRLRRANRPLHSVNVYLHDGKGVDERPTSAHASTVTSKELEYQELDNKLCSKSLLVLGGKPRYITKRKKKCQCSGGLKLENRTGLNLRKRKKQVESFDPFSSEVWPVTMQPTADQRASVHSLIVQLPTAKSSGHMLCAGSALVSFSEEASSKKRQHHLLRRRHRHGEMELVVGASNPYSIEVDHEGVEEGEDRVEEHVTEL